MDQETIANMRGRAAMCRRLAKSTNDERATKTLSQMAVEIEADIKRLEASHLGTDGEGF